jgi:hypothetical protein
MHDRKHVRRTYIALSCLVHVLMCQPSSRREGNIGAEDDASDKAGACECLLANDVGVALAMGG